MGTWTVYIVECRDGSLYTGISNRTEQRIAAHNAGKGAAYTRSRRPVRLVYRERRGNRGLALKREAAIKKLSRSEKIELIQHGPKRTGK